MAEVTVGNNSIVVDDGTEQRVKNYLAIEDIKQYLDEFWTEKKLGKHKNMKEKHGELLLKDLKVPPEEFFKDLKNSKFKLGNFGPSPIKNILINAKLNDDLQEKYISDCMKVTTTRPVIGKGEFLFASLFNNIGFTKKSGDLIDVETNETIECKGVNASFGNGQNNRYKPLTKSLIYSILKYLKIDDIAPDSLKTDYVQVLKKRIGDNDRALAKVFVALQNLEQEYEPLGEQCVKLYKDKKQFLRVVAASHIFTYMNIEKADYLLALNDRQFMMFERPNTLEEAYKIAEHFDINGWNVGEYGVKVTLK